MAERLTRILGKAGLKVFDSSCDLQSGKRWDDQIIRAIKKSDAVVFVVPEREGEGKLALFEVGAARALGKQIVTVLPDPMRYPNQEVGSSLSQSSVIDASRMTDELLGSSIASALR